jgi:hypothetical protein
MSSLKTTARKLFSPLLDRLENSDATCVYTPKSRLILWVMSLLFFCLGAGLALFLPAGTDRAFLIPVTVFCLLGLFGMVVAWLGSDQAVARLWRNR